MERELKNRAMSAYFRAATKESGGIGSVMQPTEPEIIEVDGLSYVVVFNSYEVLAVYRIRTVNGKEVLKGLKRWPAELNSVV